MMITVESPNKKKSRFSFSEQTKIVVVGRKPKTEDEGEEVLALDEPYASRIHLKFKVKKRHIYALDVGSSNGTKINSEPIEANKWVACTHSDKIQLGQSESIIRVALRERSSSKSSSEGASSQSSSEDVERSREKKTKGKLESSIAAEFKISDSTMKMLKQMTADRKSKEERIKFLKLMGCKNIDKGWQEIEKYLKGQIIFNSASKRAAEELEKQFSLGRSNAEKKGLGRR